MVKHEKISKNIFIISCVHHKIRDLSQIFYLLIFEKTDLALPNDREKIAVRNTMPT